MKNINDLIIENENLIYKIASKFYDYDIEDLYQIGVIGLIKASKNFQDVGAKFSTYAYQYIYGEIYNYVISNKSIKNSKNNLKIYKSILKAQDYLRQKLQKEPSITELSLFLEIDESTIASVISSVTITLSLDENFESDDETSLYNFIKHEDKNNLDNFILQDAMNNLNDDEKAIINYRYFNDFTQSETAKKLGMTQVMISRYEKKSLSKIKSMIAS